MTHKIVLIGLVGAGGALGAITRYVISLYCVWRYQGFPLGTLVANAVGCMIAGILFSILSIKFMPHNTIVELKLLLVTGFCGGLTTFSTFSLENMQLLQSGRFLESMIHMLAHIIFAIGGCYLGMLVVEYLF